jgi:hypothetical protein
MIWKLESWNKSKLMYFWSWYGSRLMYEMSHSTRIPQSTVNLSNAIRSTLRFPSFLTSCSTDWPCRQSYYHLDNWASFQIPIQLPLLICSNLELYKYLFMYGICWSRSSVNLLLRWLYLLDTIRYIIFSMNLNS